MIAHLNIQSCSPFYFVDHSYITRAIGKMHSSHILNNQIVILSFQIIIGEISPVLFLVSNFVCNQPLF